MVDFVECAGCGADKWVERRISGLLEKAGQPGGDKSYVVVGQRAEYVCAECGLKVGQPKPKPAATVTTKATK